MAGAKSASVSQLPSKSTAQALAQAKWQGSGISNEAARLLKLRGLPGPETQALCAKFHPIASLHLPYFDFDGNPTEFYRVRYLEPLPGFAGQVEKPQRYAQAPGTLNEIYLPPLLAKPWSEIASDVSATIYVTEGELKAAAATQAGYPTIGLGGVDVWRSAKRGVVLLPQLKTIQWASRNVVILFDSDAAENPRVVNAQRRLAAELLAMGATPRIAALPPADDGGKVGLDDFLLVQGTEALKAVIDGAPAYPEAEALWALNEEIVYSRSPGIVIVRANGRRMSVGDFERHVYANRHVMVQVTTPSGRVSLRKEPLAPRWIEWEHRFEVDEIVYEPGKPRLYDGRWNAWPGWGAEEKQGSVKLWNELLDYIFPYDPDSRRWFEQWVAYPIQYPGTKLYTSVLLWSTKHGTGKTLLAYLIKSVYGNANAVEITSENLRASFNGWAENRQFVIGDEITAGDARIDKDKLKFIITRKEIMINQKYLPEYVIRDCINYLFNSNSPDALFVEDFDRRHFIQEIVNDPLPREFYEECDAWLKGDAAANLLWHLRRVDLTGFNPREHAPTTAAKRAMIIAGKSELGMWVQELKEDPKTKLRPLGEEIATKCELFTPGQLLRAFDPEGHKRVTAPGMARELIRAGFRPLNGGSPIRTRDTTARLYAIRNQRDWIARNPKVMAEHYEKFLLDATKF
jgi:hypothetical protein